MDCADKVTALEWSPDSEYLLAGSKDLTVRLFCLKKLSGYNKPFLFLGHRDTIVGCFFGVDKKTKRVSRVYTVSRDGAIFSWSYTSSGNESKFDELEGEKSGPPSPGTPDQRPIESGVGDGDGDDDGDGWPEVDPPNEDSHLSS